jgi:hypothetical protein
MPVVEVVVMNVPGIDTRYRFLWFRVTFDERVKSVAYGDQHRQTSQVLCVRDAFPLKLTTTSMSVRDAKGCRPAVFLDKAS